MKYLLAIILSLTILTLHSCKKNKTETPVEIPAGISFKVNGVSVNMTYGYYAYNHPVTQGYTLLVGSTNSDSFVMGINAYSKPGTYPLDARMATYASNSGTQQYDALSGTIIINTFTATNITGTFEFTAQGNKDGSKITVTEGKFNSPIIAPPPYYP